MAKGQRVGYIRVSTLEQSTLRQLHGIELDRVFEDKLSGKNMDRAALNEMLAYVREGDVVLVHSMDRLARNLDDLRRIVFGLADKGVTVEFQKENLTFAPGGASPMAVLLLSVMGAFAEFERAILRERQKEGIAMAKKAGKYLGRSRALKPEQIKEARSRLAAGVPKAVIARELGISRPTLYGYLSGEQQTA